MEYTRRTIVDAGYFSDWKQYNLGGIAFRRLPKPIEFKAQKIAKANNPIQVNRDFVPVELADLCYTYTIDIYVATSLINAGLTGEGIFNPNSSSGTKEAIESALLANGFYYAPVPGTSILGKAPLWSRQFMNGAIGFPFENLSGTLGESLAAAEDIEKGVGVGAFEQGENSVYNVLINTNKTRGYFVAEGSNDAIDLRNDWGVWVDIAGNVMRIDVGLWGYLPLPESTLQGRNLQWMIPKLFVPYVSFGNGIVVCTWIGVSKPDPAQAGMNWNVVDSIAWGPTPAAPYSHFFPCTLLQGIDDSNGGVNLYLEKFNPAIPLPLNTGGFYNAEVLIPAQWLAKGMLTITGDKNDATITAGDGTVWEHFDLTNNGTMATSPGRPTTYGTNWPRNQEGANG